MRTARILTWPPSRIWTVSARSWNPNSWSRMIKELVDKLTEQAMSRGDHLRQLAAQLTMLAALEDSVALGISRVMGTASSGGSIASTAAGSHAPSAAATAPSAAPSTPLRDLSSHEAATALLRAAATTSASSRACSGNSFVRVSVRRCDPGLHGRHSGSPETALEDPVHPVEDPVNSLHYPVSSLGCPT